MQTIIIIISFFEYLVGKIIHFNFSGAKQLETETKPEVEIDDSGVIDIDNSPIKNCKFFLKPNEVHTCRNLYQKLVSVFSKLLN